MSKTKVGTEASQQTDSEIYFQTYQGLMRQRKEIDKEISKIQKKVFKTLSRSSGQSVSRVKYIPRLNNTMTLVQAIRKCMTNGKEMTMKDILKSLSKKKLYHTNSDSLYTMVNNKLNRDEHIKKASRGVFVYTPRSRKKSRAAA